MAKMPAAPVVRRVLYVLASVLPVWAVLAFFTGGVGWMLGPIRLSSREPVRPLIIGIAIAVWYFWKYPGDERASDARWLHRGAARALPLVVPLVIALAYYLGVHYGSFAAAGSDSYGYVSQARLWLAGIPRVEQPWVQDFSWNNREWVFSPLGYRPVSTDGTIVALYPAGLPMMMAVFLAVLGDNGPFYVVPVLGALTLWFTYLLGREATGSKAVAALATMLVLASPVFLTHLMVPMSDVPAAAGWTLVAVLTLKQRSLAAGIVAGATLLVRPNLIPLALMPAFAWRRRGEPLLQYALGILPGVVAVVILNTVLFGGPLTSGYGSVFELYGFGLLPANVRNYGGWMVQTQTVLIVLALVPLFVRDALPEPRAGVSTRRCLAAMVGLTFLSYLFYAPFDHWFYLRFLLPAYPALFVLQAVALRWVASKVPVECRVTAAAIVCAVVVPFGVNVGRQAGIFAVAAYEGRYVRAANEVASRTPADAVVLSVQHSGSVRYYANRITLRYDALQEDALDAALRDLAARRRRAYLVVDDWEEKEFRSRFSASHSAAQLGAPIARVSGSPEVRIFEFQDGGPAPTQ
jgi:hypothetical protein